MKQRLKRFDRLIKVQQHLHKSAELQLAHMQQEESRLKAAQEEILHAMGDSSELHGLFVDVKSRKLKVLALEEVKAQEAIITQKAVTTEKAMQVKRAEKTFERLREQIYREQEKKDLAAILEAMTQRNGTSLP